MTSTEIFSQTAFVHKIPILQKQGIDSPVFLFSDR